MHKSSFNILNLTYQEPFLKLVVTTIIGGMVCHGVEVKYNVYLELSTMGGGGCI